MRQRRAVVWVPAVCIPLLMTVAILCAPITLDLTTGSFASETYFTLANVLDLPTNIPFDSFSPAPDAALADGTADAGDLVNSTVYQFSWDLGPGDYRLTVGDTFGDGMNGGNYELTVDGSVVRTSDGDFDFTEETDFSVTGIPEPATLGLVAIGLAGVAIWRRRRVA